MLIISNLLGECTYEGAHPITGKQVKVKWKEFSQEELWGFIDMSPENKNIFEPESSFIRPEPTIKTKQADNVNTTAPSTRTANDTVTTTAKGTLS